MRAIYLPLFCLLLACGGCGLFDWHTGDANNVVSPTYTGHYTGSYWMGTDTLGTLELDVFSDGSVRAHITLDHPQVGKTQYTASGTAKMEAGSLKVDVHHTANGQIWGFHGTFSTTVGKARIDGYGGACPVCTTAHPPCKLACYGLNWSALKR